MGKCDSGCALEQEHKKGLLGIFGGFNNLGGLFKGSSWIWIVLLFLLVFFLKGGDDCEKDGFNWIIILVLIVVFFFGWGGVDD